MEKRTSSWIGNKLFIRISIITSPYPSKNFYPDGFDNPPISVDMMANGGRFPFYDAREYGCRIIGLPYRHNMTTMYVIQPDNSDRQRLRDLQATLTADKIDAMIAKMQWQTAIVLFPKLKLSNQLNLKDVLSKMGLRTLFSQEESDLALISNGLGAEEEPIAGHAFLPPLQFESGVLPSRSAVSLPPLPQLPARIGGVLLPSADNDDDEPFIFSRSEDDNRALKTRTRRNAITYKVPSEQKSAPAPLTVKSFILSKRITKTKPGKKTPNGGVRRVRRQIDLSQGVKQLDELRKKLRNGETGAGLEKNGLFVDEIVHQVELSVNEKGTAGGAATVTTLFRTGTDVVMRVETPFMFMIRHDETKLPLFYGAVFEPTN